MVIIRVVAMFDDPAVLLRAKEELVRAGLATEEAMHTEPSSLPEHSETVPAPTGWERLLAFFDTEADHDVSAYAEGLRRGSALLVVETPTEQAEKIKDVLRRSGAIDLRRRVNRWITTGWQTFDPAAPTFTELEILDERRASMSEAEIVADASRDQNPDSTITLYNDTTGQELGRISEVELAVLQDALEEERPGDDDYWINGEALESIAASPGATPHLVALLRSAVSGKPDGVDIRFERDGEDRSGVARRGDANGRGA
ncbi:MAG: hypothetical protein ABR587_02245 [Candidatus Binatia bacterium]